MPTIVELKAENKMHLEGARAICDTAESERREFTDAERAEIKRHMDEAGRLKAQIEAPDTQKAENKSAEDELRKQILEWGRGLESGYNKGAGVWSKAFEKALSFYRPSLGNKALISPSGSVAVPGFSNTVPGLQPGEVVSELLQFIPRSGLDGTDGFSYLRETVRNHAADVVAAGDTKPTSTYTVQRIDDRVRTIAHLSEPIPRQYLADMALLRQYLDGALREGYRLAVEDQIINGGGAGENLTGFLHTANTWVQYFDTDPLITTRKAITTLELVSITPTGWLMNPQDWETFELLTDMAARYMMSAPGEQPINRAQRRLWSVPVALSTAMPQGTGLLADFAGSTKVWEREAVNVDWSENTYDNYLQRSDFEANMVRFRCEGRLGFGVLRPQGVVQVDLNAGS